MPLHKIFCKLLISCRVLKKVSPKCQLLLSNQEVCVFKLWLGFTQQFYKNSVKTISINQLINMIDADF